MNLTVAQPFVSLDFFVNKVKNSNRIKKEKGGGGCFPKKFVLKKNMEGRRDYRYSKNTMPVTEM